MAQHRLFSEDDMNVGDKSVVKIDGNKILVIRLDDGFHAVQNTCTHLFAPLGRGKIVDESCIECPFHRAAFDVRTGEVVRWANFPKGIQLLNTVRKEKALATYPVTVSDGQVYIEVSQHSSSGSRKRSS